MYGMSLETKMRAGIDYVVNFLIFEKSKAGSAANEIVGMIGYGWMMLTHDTY